MLIGLSLFTGIGGLDVALSEYVRPIAYCEIDPYCQGILLSRMADRSLQWAPIWDDIRTFPIQGKHPDVLYGGFPCQDISIAGNGKGLAGQRSGLFFEIMRLAKESKPKFIFLENVPAITTRGGLRVVREIAEMGYGCRWCTLAASEIGARHKRERWFLLAHSNEKRLQRYRVRTFSNEKKFNVTFNSSTNVSDTRCESKRSKEESKWASKNTSRYDRFWEVEPSICRVVDGISNRLDRIKCLGNSVVPQQAKEAFKILMGIKE